MTSLSLAGANGRDATPEERHSNGAPSWASKDGAIALEDWDALSRAVLSRLAQSVGELMAHSPPQGSANLAGARAAECLHALAQLHATRYHRAAPKALAAGGVE